MKCKIIAVTVAALLSVVTAGPAYAAYSEQQFTDALYGYFELAYGNNAQAAHILLATGTELGNAEILRDATHAAIRIPDVALAQRAGEQWYAHGGSGDAIEILARIKVSVDGLEASQSLLKRLADEAGTAAVFSVIRTAANSTWQLEAMRASHPLHARDDTYIAYLALLMLTANDTANAYAVINTALIQQPDSINLLIVALLIADATSNDVASITIARRLAQVANTRLSNVVVSYQAWKQHISDPYVRLPSVTELANFARHTPNAFLNGGLFLYQHKDYAAALELYKLVPRQSREWPSAIRGQIYTYRQLDDDTHHQDILNLLTAEIQVAPDEYLDEYVVAYVNELRRVEGHQDAFVFLNELTRTQNSTTLLFELSIDAERIGRVDVAERALRRHIKIEELNEERWIGYNALSYLFAVHNIKLDEALALVEMALILKPNSPAIIDTHGWVLYRRGDFTAAIKRLERSLNLLEHPNAEILAHLGEVLWEAGEHERAKRIWRQALTTDAHDYYLLETLKRYADKVDFNII